MNKLLLVVAAVLAGLAVTRNDAQALNCTSPITCTDGTIAAATVLTGTPTNHGVAIGGSAQALSFAGTGTSGQYLKSGGAGADPAMATIATGDLPTAVVIESDIGAGLSVTSNTVNVQSDEAGFLVDGGTTDLTCGSSTAGKMQVMDSGVLQYCDGQSTAVRTYAALADSSGNASAANALKSATTTVNVSSATAPSNGQCLKATGASAATWQSCTTGSGTDHIYTVSETKLATGSGTVYMGVTGLIGTSESDVAVPVVGSSASTYGRLRCRASAATGGSGVAITMGVAPNSSGACGSWSYTSKPTVTVTTTDKVGDTSNTATASENDCIAYKIVSSSTSTSAFIQCAIERS